jgi:signal peptidase I
MAPTLHDGDRLMVRQVRGTAVRTGQVTVVEHPDHSDGTYRNSVHDLSRQPLWMIKRCVAVAGDAVPAGLPDRCDTPDGRVPEGLIVVLGDNPTHPNDSRRFGYLPCERVLGVVMGARSRSLMPPSAVAGNWPVTHDQVESRRGKRRR